MFINNFNPVALEFFSFEIRWYSLAYIFGIILAWIYCKKFLIKDEKILNLFDDFISYIIIGLILGGRFGYIIFYNLSYYSKNILEIFMIWKGGMSFHGGLLGVIFTTMIFAKNHKINPYIFLDLIAAAAPIGIFFGRIANFINSELYGKETDLFWGVKFVLIDNLSRHPSQLYEAFLEGIFLFLLLNFFIKRNYLINSGLISAIFLIFYSLFRFIAEFFRVPDPQIGYILSNFTLGQFICTVFFLLGTFLFLYKKNEN